MKDYPWRLYGRSGVTGSQWRILGHFATAEAAWDAAVGNWPGFPDRTVVHQDTDPYDGRGHRRNAGRRNKAERATDGVSA